MDLGHPLKLSHIGQVPHICNISCGKRKGEQEKEKKGEGQKKRIIGLVCLTPQECLPAGHALRKPFTSGKESHESLMSVFALYSLKASALLLSNLNWLGTLNSLLQPLLLPLPSEIPGASWQACRRV